MVDLYYLGKVMKIQDDGYFDVETEDYIFRKAIGPKNGRKYMSLVLSAMLFPTLVMFLEIFVDISYLESPRDISNVGILSLKLYGTICSICCVCGYRIMARNIYRLCRPKFSFSPDCLHPEFARNQRGMVAFLELKKISSMCKSMLIFGITGLTIFGWISLWCQPNNLEFHYFILTMSIMQILLVTTVLDKIVERRV